MASFKQAVSNTPVMARTANGMKTNQSSLNANLDLFFQIGSSRGKNLIPQFESAYQNDRVVALRTLAWSRDVRGGAGERGTFRNLLKFIEQNHPNELEQMVNVTPIYGRWDDLLELVTPKGRSLALARIQRGLNNPDEAGLCAKWMPRKGPWAVALTKFLNLSPKRYRKLVVGLTDVVEQKMCAKEWSNITYKHVPSVAAGRYAKAFGRHDPEGYGAYKTKLVTGEESINASALFPYQVIRTMRSDPAIATAQWEALPNYIGDELILPLVDVSGSMSCPVAGTPGLTCMDVAVSLGLYLADKNSGPFKDMFITFTDNAKIEVLNGDIRSKLSQLQGADWGMSTNLHSAFNEILRVATKNHVSEADMPKYVLIMSDMQFNQCTTYDDSAMEMIRRKYADAGYTVPNVIFWQLNARPGNSPATANEKGVALISGFSPAIMTSVLKAENVTPVDIMLTTINSERYQVIV